MIQPVPGKSTTAPEKAPDSLAPAFPDPAPEEVPSNTPPADRPAHRRSVEVGASIRRIQTEEIERRDLEREQQLQARGKPVQAD